jgi:hypothetical protein
MMARGSCRRTNLAGFAARLARTAGGENRPSPPATTIIPVGEVM